MIEFQPILPGFEAHRRSPKLTAGEIQQEVADWFRIPVAEMVSARRFRSVARPRQIAMYLTRELTPKSLPEIGLRFGGRDHTTVIYAIKNVERLCAIDGEIDDDVRGLRRRLLA